MNYTTKYKIQRCKEGHKRRFGGDIDQYIYSFVGRYHLKIFDHEKNKETEWDISAWRVRFIFDRDC